MSDLNKNEKNYVKEIDEAMPDDLMNYKEMVKKEVMAAMFLHVPNKF